MSRPKPALFYNRVISSASEKVDFVHPNIFGGYFHHLYHLSQLIHNETVVDFTCCRHHQFKC